MIILSGLIATLGPACVAQRLVPPEPPTAPTSMPPDLSELSVAVRTFDVTNQSEEDLRLHTKQKLENAFFEHLMQSATYGLLLSSTNTQSGELADDIVKLDVDFSVEEDENRTIVFDAIFFYPFVGTFPFTPMWGTVTVDATVNIWAFGKQETPVVVKVMAPYSIIFYSWYRVGPVEEAFQRAHEAAFREVLKQLVTKLVAIQKRHREDVALAKELAAKTASVAMAAVESATTTAVAEAEVIPVVDLDHRRHPIPTLATEMLPTLPLVASAIPVAEPPPAEPPPPAARELLRLEPVGVNIIDQPFSRRESPGLLERYLGALGGIEGCVTGGIASVQSGAVTQSGLRETVGSGRATSSGYRVALYQPPDRTGFFFPPVIGFLSQQIEISGFRDDIPVFNVQNADTIPAVVSDPATGAPVDPGDPISYNLDLKSGYIGQGIGLNLVLGTEDVQFFSTLRAGINLAEFRHSFAQINTTATEGNSFAFFQSGSLGGQVGLSFPSLHAAIRAAVNYEWYAEFQYPQKLEFQAKTTFNEEKQVFERERVFVESVALQTFDWQLSLVALF